MASTFTPARGLEQPAAGDQVGTWGTNTVNPNMGVIDASLAQTGTVGVSAGANIVLTATQCRNARLTFSSTLTASITVTFVTSINGPYTINNTAGGSSAFTVTLQTTAAGGRVIACPPFQQFDIWNDGTNIDFHNFGPPVGGYWDYAGSSEPTWNSCCTVKPYLNCDGSTFASSVYPQLAIILGSTTLPDLRGRYRATLNQGTGRLTSSQVGIDGETLKATGGITALTSLHLPQSSDAGHFHFIASTQTQTVVLTDATSSSPLAFRGLNTNFEDYVLRGTTTGSSASLGMTDTKTTGITYGSSSQMGFVPPTCIGGITLIRAG